MRQRLRRSSWLLTALLLLAVPLAAQNRAPKTTLPVMTFNLRYGTADDGPNAWPLRRDLVLRTIREASPAVLGLQEALRFQLDELGRALEGFGEIGVGRNDGNTSGEYAAILYDRDRVESLDQGWFWLSDAPDVPGSTTWGNQDTRIVTWARFRDRTDGSTFYFFNTHWDHQSQNARERSAGLLRLRIATRTHQEDPVIVTGDFNAAETNAAFVALLGTDLRDSFRMRYPNERGVATYHAFKGGVQGDKIDGIVVGPGWNVQEAAIIRSNQAGRYPSDHYPVTALLQRAW